MSAPGDASSLYDRNPYVGPRAFRKDELFFGREAEKEGLLDALLPGGVALLHSPSGAGKTSLIQAAVVPLLLEMDFQVCAASKPRFSALRVNLPPPPDLPTANRYVFSIVNGLVGHLVNRREAAAMTIEGALDLFARLGPVGRDSRRWTATEDHPAAATRPDARPQGPQQVVIIDQLEEALTLDPNDISGQAVFFRQLGQALRRGRRWALLSMREDHIGGIDKFKRYFHNELRTTYRLDYLDEKEALQAVVEPAAKRGVTFEEEAARQLVTDLRRVRADRTPELIPRPGQADIRRRKGTGLALTTDRRSDGPAGARPAADHGARHVPVDIADPYGGASQEWSSQSDELLYPYVEPVLLQVVCDSLWRILSKDRNFSRITVTNLAEVRPYDTILSKYYRSVVRKAAGDDIDTERAIRDWVEEHLLTKQGLRRPTRALPHVDNPTEVLDVLQRRYLIRDDPRPGGTWWELAHDMLVPPVIQDNRAWQLSNLAAWQVVADEWYRTGRPRDLLLKNSDLREARWAARKGEVTAVEEEFLVESERVAEDEGQRARLLSQRNFFRTVMFLSLVLNVVLLLHFVLGG
jgi:hypothetical protein